MSRLRVVVMGWLIRGPAGGIAWHYLNYVLGLAELGHDVYYVEDSGDAPVCYDADLMTRSADSSYGLRFASNVFEQLGLTGRWAYYDAPAEAWVGMRGEDAHEVCRTADLVLNVSGANSLRDWLQNVPARVLIDTDPGFTQIRNLTDAGFRRRCSAHTAFFSFGENIGNPCCSIPRDGFPWQPTRQPVACDAWPKNPPTAHGNYTTVITFESPDRYAFEDVEVNGLKSQSFQPFMNLPRRLGAIFNIAVRGPEEVLKKLRGLGWHLADIDAVANDPLGYQAFINASKAEFGIAKPGYVVTRSGWFSERSAVYLASGRPVVAQDTGFPDWLPCGAGVFAFSSPDDVVETVAEIDARYEMHCQAAREIAEAYFGARRVLPALIEAAMASDSHAP